MAKVSKKKSGQAPAWWKRALRFFSLALLSVFLLSIVWVVALRYVPVYYTPLMLIRTHESRLSNSDYHIRHQWVPIEDISPELIRAVMASEDNLFLKHNGFSKGGIERAIREKRETGHVRHGGSTISQQTAKNVFCTHRRNFVRKGAEAYFTVLIEFFWGKRRIMEVYLNSIEMGDGIYGAEAAAQTFFHHSASRLSRSESALIAVCLPNPRKMFVSRPSQYVRGRQQAIITLMPKLGRIPDPLPDTSFRRNPEPNQ